MPYDKTDAAAWWRAAEPLPPRPDEPGDWTPTATPYGWTWSRADEPASDAADTAGMLAEGCRALDRIAAKAQTPTAGVSVVPGDRVLLVDQQRYPELNGARVIQQTPDPSFCYVMPDGRMSTSPAGCIGIAGPVGSVGSPGTHHVGAALKADVMGTRVWAFDKAYHACPGHYQASIAAGLRAADAVTDPRRDVLERVAQAARDATAPALGGLGAAYVRLCGALRALAALDQEGGR